MYPSVVFSTVSFIVLAEGVPVEQAEINIDGYEDAVFSDHQGKAHAVLTVGTHNFTVSANGYVSYQGQFELDESDIELNINLDVATSISVDIGLPLHIFPNPASDVLNISLTPGINNYLEVYSSNGKLIHTETSEQAEIRLDLANYYKGLYILTIKAGNAIRSGKFLKN